MARLTSYLSDTWSTIKEIDLRPIRDQALRGVKIAIVGAPGSGRSTLAAQMRRDPARPQAESVASVLILDLDSAGQAEGADLIILMMDSRKTDSTQEQELVMNWYNAGQKVLTFINQFEEALEAGELVKDTEYWFQRWNKRPAGSKAKGKASVTRKK